MLVDYSRQSVLQKPSRFITECPPALFEIWNLEEESMLDMLPDPPAPTEYMN
jgi:hypothetical protein